MPLEMRFFDKIWNLLTNELLSDRAPVQNGRSVIPSSFAFPVSISFV